MTLSKDSKHLPTIEECLKCPFVDKCNSGEKCLVNRKPRDRREEYQKKKVLKNALSN